MDDTRKVQARNLDILYIGIEEFQKIIGGTSLVRVLHTDAELIRIRSRKIQGKTIIVSHCLNQLEQVNHVHAEYILCGTKICLKPLTVKA